MWIVSHLSCFNGMLPIFYEYHAQISIAKISCGIAGYSTICHANGIGTTCVIGNTANWGKILRISFYNTIGTWQICITNKLIITCCIGCGFCNNTTNTIGQLNPRTSNPILASILYTIIGISKNIIYCAAIIIKYPSWNNQLWVNTHARLVIIQNKLRCRTTYICCIDNRP